MCSENTKEFASEYKNHFLGFISEIQFGIIDLIKNHNQHLSRILLSLSFRLMTTQNDTHPTVVFYILLLDAPICKTISHLWTPPTISILWTPSYTLGNLKIFVCQTIILSQNYEFSQLCVPPTYLSSLHFGKGE